MKKEIKNSKGTIWTQQKSYLVNKNFLSNFKAFFTYEKISFFMNKYQIQSPHQIDGNFLITMKEQNDDYFNLISSANISEFIVKNNFCEIETFNFGKYFESFLCPKNFNILDEFTFNNLLGILNLKDMESKKEELFYGLN